MEKETSIIFACLPLLPLLLVTSLLAIILLSVSLYHCRCKLDRTREYLVRYINECLELRKQVPTSRRTFHFNPPGITSEEFIKIIENMLKRIMFLPLFLLLASCVKDDQHNTPPDASGTRRYATLAATRSSALSATVRLPGVMPGETQLLTLSLTLSDGHTHTLATDLTEALKNFGTDVAPLALDATLQLPTPAGIGGSITDWTVVNNGNVEIN